MARPRPPELMRQQNRAVILAAIREHGPISRAELARQLDLNPATVTRITRALLDEGVIVETGEGESRGAGRKPVLLSFNHRARLVIGIQECRGRITGAVADLAGTILSRRTHLSTPAPMERKLQLLLDDLLSVDPSYRPRLTAICVGVLDDDGSLPAMPSMPDVPIMTANVAELATRAEARWGAAQEYHKFAVLYLGATSHACVYIDGEICVGGLGLGRDGRPLAMRLCDDGLIAAALAGLESGRPSALRAVTGGRELSRGMIFEAARQGDPVAWDAVKMMADDIAFAVCWFYNALSLDCVLLDGPWGGASDVLVPLVNDRVREVCADSSAIVPAGLGDEAPLLGAIDAAVEVAGATV